MNAGATARAREGAGSSPEWLEIGALRDELRAALRESRLSQKRAANKIGISDAALSQWLRGKYGGDHQAVSSKVRRWLDSRAALESVMAVPPAWVETPTARRVLAGLSYAQMAGDVAVVYGGAGSGKTVAARRYADGHPNVWVATMTASTRAWGPALARVASACGLGSRQVLAWRLETELVDRLEGTRGLLVIDEAQHLETRALEGLRGIYDATGVGLALVGNELVYARLTGGRRAAEYAQMFSRIGKRVRLTHPSQADVEALLRAWPVRGRKEREVLVTIAKSPGGLRGVTKTLRLAGMFAAGEVVKVRHLQAAWRDLGGV